MKTLLKEKINLEPYAEDTAAKDPLTEIIDNTSTVNEALILIQEHLENLKNEYPEYTDFKYEYESKGYGCGAYSAWFNLIGIKEDNYEK